MNEALATRTTEIADRIGDVLDILADDSAALDDWAAAFAVGQQLRLRMDRALKQRRDDIIVGMERQGLKELGPLSIKATAVDPSYPCNAPENHEDTGIQEAMAALFLDRSTRPYVRIVPAHSEIAVDVLAHDIRMGVQAAIDLYRQLNEKRWRTEQARRLSLAVKEVRHG